MTRQQKLIEWATTKIGTPFIWGSSDCSSLSLEGIKLYYGDLFSFENTWSSLKEAIRAYKKYGTPIEILESVGFVRVKRNYEQTGDVFVWTGNSYYLVGMVINQSVIVADEEKCLELRSLSSFNSYLCYRKDI